MLGHCLIRTRIRTFTGEESCIFHSDACPYLLMLLVSLMIMLYYMHLSDRDIHRVFHFPLCTVTYL
jgi:hypothetical protein